MSLLSIVDLLLQDLQITLAEQELTLEIAPEVKVKLTELGSSSRLWRSPPSQGHPRTVRRPNCRFHLRQLRSKQLKAILEEDKIIVQAKEIA